MDKWQQQFRQRNGTIRGDRALMIQEAESEQRARLSREKVKANRSAFIRSARNAAKKRT